MEPPPTPDQGPSGDQHLAGLERRLAAIDERLGRLESALRPTVAEEVHGATAELRRAITELGRRLVQDLPHELARHRDVIVAELRPPPPSAGPLPPAPDFEEAPPVPASPATMAPESTDPPEPADKRRALRRRRRHG